MTKGWYSGTMKLPSIKRRKEQRTIIKEHAGKRLRRTFSLLIGIYIVLLLASIYHLVTHPVVWWQAVLCGSAGLAIGMLFSRMTKIEWDKDHEKAIGRMDIYGGVILVLFILFEIFRSQLVGLFADGAAIGTLSLLLLTNTMYGRVIAMGGKIIHTVRDNK